MGYNAADSSLADSWLAPRILRCLLEAGVDKDRRMDDGLTPLHVASLHGHLQIIELLLSVQADFDATDDTGATALQYAAQEGAAQLVARLL